MRRAVPHLPRRVGVTLIELLLVLALLVVMAGLAVPIVNEAFASVRLRRASDQILAAWSLARTDAIDDGVIRQFRFVPQEGRYRIEPWAGLDATDDPGGSRYASGASTAPAALSTGTTTTNRASINRASAIDQTTEADDVVEQALPERVTFYRGQRAVEAAPDAQAQLLELSVTSGPGLTGSWSESILFFPDGTTSDASLVIANDRKQYQRLRLRGLSGVGSVSVVLDADELDRSQGR